MFSLIKKLFGKASAAAPAEPPEDESANDQLWVMIKTDDIFRSEIHRQVEAELTELMESQKFGVADGSSSGAHQFDVNFCEVTEFEKAKSAVAEFLREKYPQMQFVISDDYEATFDQL